MAIKDDRGDDVGSAATLAGSATEPTQPSLAGATGASLPAAPPTLVADRYVIQGLLGMGGMGRVYRAHDRVLDEAVALKMLRRELVDVPGMLERFRQEVKLARRVTSPHVVRTFDLGQHGDEHFLTMELVDGRSLAQLLDEGPLPLPETLRIARAAADGIAAAHATGVLHRDLKPDNILVARTGRIALSDFGIARPSGAPTATADRFVGTPAYMAPEQVEGADEIGPAADVYAFGAILYEMLAGQRPFPGRDPFAVALARLRQPPPDPRDVRAVPDALAELVRRCMARSPADRFGDGRALAAALAALGDPTAAPEQPRFRPIVPERGARAVAIVPLRASGALAEVAEGLSEEIVDALSMTRALRVRPLASVRTASGGDRDPRELGQALGVDVIVDGSLRPRGGGVRLAARAVGVADGFVLWASHVDAAPDGLLEASDEIVKAIARALTVELEVPGRPERNGRLAELYLEYKARLRNFWIEGELQSVIRDVDRAIEDAPDDPGLVATLALALARSGFYGNQAHLARARAVADRAVELAPASGEAYLARACAHLYAARPAETMEALCAAVRYAPGHAGIQGMLGGLLLEAGALPEAVAHLEAAMSLDPTRTETIDLARAHFYAGASDEALALLQRVPPIGLRELTIARFKAWRGERYQQAPTVPPELRSELARFLGAAVRGYRAGTLSAEDRAQLEAGLGAAGPRLRATQSQYLAELLAMSGDVEGAVAHVEGAAAAGLYDAVWLARCPLLDTLRTHPRFRAAAEIVGARAAAILAKLPERAQA